MHSFIVANPPPFTPGPNVLEIHSETSIGIDEIRQIQHFLSRKATQSHNLVIIYSAHTLTLPAQNALLKTLEEPPSGCQIYLITSYPDQLLATILSRCQVISSSSQDIPKDIQPAQDLLHKLLTTSEIRKRLEILDSQEFDRSTALEFLDHLEWGIHSQIHTQKPPINYDLISQTRKYLKANCSVKLTLDHFAINL